MEFQLSSLSFAADFSTDFHLLNNVINAQECDATKDEPRNEAGNIKSKLKTATTHGRSIKRSSQPH
jgi:hypothetical protein